MVRDAPLAKRLPATPDWSVAGLQLPVGPLPGDEPTFVHGATFR
jgi:hypothetical protein